MLLLIQKIITIVSLSLRIEIKGDEQITKSKELLLQLPLALIPPSPNLIARVKLILARQDPLKKAKVSVREVVIDLRLPQQIQQLALLHIKSQGQVMQNLLFRRRDKWSRDLETRKTEVVDVVEETIDGEAAPKMVSLRLMDKDRPVTRR